MTSTLPPVAENPGQATMDLERDYLLQNYARYPLVAARGRGCYLYDTQGRRYLDFITGIGVNALGHAHPRMVKTIREQAGLLIHSSNLYYNEYQGRLAQRLAQNAPAGLAATKALIHRAPTSPIEAQLDAERDAIIDCMHTDEFRAAVKKFTSKGK